MQRMYIVDCPGGTNTSTIQIQAKATLKRVLISAHNAAAGFTEVSTSPTTQIGTTQPTSNVLCRIYHSATAGDNFLDFPMSLSLTPFQSIYIHQSGAGNLATVNLQT